jgi:hypothetical protein
MRLIATALCAPLVVAAACSNSSRCADMGFERLRQADRAVVTVDSRSVGTALRSKEALRALEEFAELHGSGWGSPWYGTPVARLRVDFFSGNRFLGDLGVGSNFLAAQGCGYVQSRKLAAADRAELVGLIGAADPYAAKR